MKWGQFELQLVSDGSLWLDGGAMFGVIPKSLWEKKAKPDCHNRIRLGLNCLLVRNGQHNLLIDTGCGFKYTKRQLEIYNIEHETNVLRELERFSIVPEEIDFVVNTHFHFDHCGGNTRIEGEEIVPTFPNATYVVRQQEYEDANSPNERTAATYFQDNWKPLEKAGLLSKVSEDEEIISGVTVVHTPGHTAGHQSVKIESEGKTLFYFADLCPTSAHVSLPWIMSFDLFPMTTLEVRKEIYEQAIQEEWLLFLEHDPEVPTGYLRKEKQKFVLEPDSWEE